MNNREEKYHSMKGSTISFHQLSYTVPITKKGKTHSKVILKSVNGMVYPNEICAIMGPTGGGKSTLLDCLAGRKSMTRMSGNLMLDGDIIDIKQYCNLICGYVQQDDILMGTLSVKENLMFSANLRLPMNESFDAKLQRVQQVIKDLNLSKVQDSYVGTELIRGISGGEKKRTNIGMELVKAPAILFLDEPTTGLDSATAGNVLDILHKQAEMNGKTIVLSIHQPKYSIFKRFHRMILMSDGELVYQGKSNCCLSYLERVMGLECEPFNNPADFFLDVINENERLLNRKKEAEEEEEEEKEKQLVLLQKKNQKMKTNTWRRKSFFDKENTTTTISSESSDTTLLDAGAGGNDSQLSLMDHIYMEEGKSNDLNDNNEQQVNNNVKSLASIFAESPEHNSIMNDLTRIAGDKLNNNSSITTTATTTSTIQYATSTWYQIKVLSKRTFLNIVRNPATNVLQLVVNLIFGGIVGGIFWQLDQGPMGLQNRVGAFFFVVMNLIFGNLSAIELFIKERPIFIHEKSSGYYSSFSYFIAKSTCDIIPMRFVPSFFFAIMTYFMMGLTCTVVKFLNFFIIMNLVSLASAGLCLFFSSMVSVFAIANLFVALCYVFMMVGGGLLLNLDSIPTWINWLQYVSIFRYGLEAMSVNELQGMTFDCQGNPQCVEDGSLYLESMGYTHSIEHNCLILLLIFAVFMTGAYFNLARLKKD